MTPFAPAPEPERRFVALIGEPDEWVLRTLGSILAPNGFEILQARSGQEVLDQASAFRPDVVLLSNDLTDIAIGEVLRRLRGFPEFSSVTPIFITTTHPLGEQERIAHLHAGAWDTLRLPTNAEELALRLRRCAEAKARSDLVQGEGILDSRTGLYTLQGILRRTEEETTEARRHKRPLACVMLGPGQDLSSALSADQERSILRNLERQVADFLRGASRRSDILGRLTSTEFIVVAPDTDEGGLVTMAGRFLSGMDELTLEASRRGELPLRMCAGLFSFPTASGETIEPMDLLSRATMALRRSQSAAVGRERMVRWSQGDEALATGLANGASSPG
jgi:PleD family two-component response regulator